MRIYNYGSINIDHVYRVPHFVQPGETLASSDYQQVLGGKGANQSIALARAGALVTHLGRYHVVDRPLLQPLWEAGVQTDALEAVDQPSGHAIIQVDDVAENAIVLYAGANHSFTPASFPSLLASAQAGDWLLLQNECSHTAAMMSLAADCGLKVAFNPAPMSEQVRSWPLQRLAVLFVNRVEVLQLLKADIEGLLDQAWLAQALQQLWPNTQVVVTLGAQGACCFYQGQVFCQAAYPVAAVDTTGAGDTFIGYYLAALIQGADIATALERGCLASALCVQRFGASSSIPLVSEVDQFAQQLAGVE